MFGILKRNNSKLFLKKTKEELKVLTRVLFIDDQEIAIVDAIKREGWKVKYISDLDCFENVDLIDSQIICIDINGVGIKLGFKNGMELVGAIKKFYPFKKILLYSSVPSHDIFHESLDLIDKRVQKTGQPYPFITAINELAEKTFDWDTCLFDLYTKYKNVFGKELSFDEFRDQMKRVFRAKGSINPKKVLKITQTTLDVAKVIIEVVTYLKSSQA